MNKPTMISFDYYTRSGANETDLTELNSQRVIRFKVRRLSHTFKELVDNVLSMGAYKGYTLYTSESDWSPTGTFGTITIALRGKS